MHINKIMFSKILVPVDGSENSKRAFNYASYLSKNLKGEITILNVAEAPPTVYVQSQKVLGELSEKYYKAREKVFEGYQELAERENIGIKTKLVFGDPKKEIVKFALKEEIDVIVIGNRGMGHLKEMLVGSVSGAVIRDSKCPVVLVK
ncbi:universal stress protein [Candidatus Nitrosocosmicus hydrocola]|uniref:universal stress protein n=1 Tax=Candidatus Nitrosocosmicus hydrocola TaxID=1826872 RepID=UPI0011E589D1|nr:universal stress protein [Candidatus Nitrosocosmicus hydrocola]